MLNKIRKSRISKGVSLLLVLLIIQPYLYDLALHANGGGPTQPEYSKFTAVGNMDHVDPFTGNLAYSIPLFDIGGYPVALSYSGDINPQQDAGWVGLGWSLNLGSINRAMRGIPDDFDGDEVLVERNARPNIDAKVVLNNLKSETVGMQTQSKPDKFKFNFNNFSLCWNSSTGVGLGVSANWEHNGLNVKDYDFSNDTEALSWKQKYPDVKLKFKDTANFPKYAIQMGIDYNSKSRTSVRTVFPNTSGKLNMLQNVNLSFNSKTSQAGLGFESGYSVKNMDMAYSSGFSKHYAMQVPPPDTRTRTYTLKLDFSSGATPAQQKRRLSGIISVTEEHLVNKSENKQAFGYFSIKDRNYPNGAIMDCEELPNSIDMKMEKYSRQLSPATKTYDVFNISAAGIGGTFRAHHNSVFMLSPSTIEKRPYVNNLALKGEFGTSELGIDIGIGVNKDKYGAIPEKNNPLVKNLKFKDETKNNLFEHTTYRNEYEFIENDLTYYGLFGSTEAVSPKIVSKLGQFGNSLLNKDRQEVLQVNGPVAKTNRDARQQMINCHTAKQAKMTSMFKDLEMYWFDQYGNPQIAADKRPMKTAVDRVSAHRKEHHLSEIVVTQPNGTRYYFSTPVYNVFSKDVNFDASEISSSNINYLNGTIQYQNSNLKKTDKGLKARFYQAKTMPAYSSTFLLNGIITQDYVDVDGNGLSENDIGDYVKINYSLHKSDYNNNNGNTNHFFRWRSPVESGTAYVSSGFKSDDFDNKAYYSYGEKEIWYTHSIETKDQIAFFYLRPRLDGWEVKDEFGGIKNTGITQMYLQQIVLFTKREFYKDGFNAKPIKTVNLDYSYDLCKNNNSFAFYNGSTISTTHPLTTSHGKEDYKGKLTLHKVWFTYGELGVRTAAPYILEYNGFNPDYANRSIDKWGTYMPQNQYQNGGSVNDVHTVSNADFPYTPQDNKTLTDQWASAWMMTDVTLPSGGTLHFDMEADEYAYVQDKKAMRMAKIYGMNNEGKVAGSKPDLYVNQQGNNKNYYVIFQKTGSSPASKYFETGDLVYYSFNVRINRKNAQSFEQVSGFFEVDQIGDASDNSQYGYIKIKPERAGMFNAHPVTRMALQYGLSNVPHNLYPGSDLRRSGFKPRAIADMIFGVLPDALSMLIGKYNYFELMGFCQTLNVNKSYLRLPEVDGVKYGGGHRVKRVVMNDRWSSLTDGNEPSASYSVEYDYLTTDENNASISSGVASYEPDAGSEENPWKEPLNAEAIKKLKSKRFKPMISYELGPIGEEFFKSPSVGYSRIVVRNVYPNANINRHKNGYSVKEFYTAKDYPTIVERTPIQVKKLRFGTPELSGKFTNKDSAKKDAKGNTKGKFGSLKLDISASFTYTAATQGISVETNDMHGKPKGEWVYAEDNLEPLSGKKYFYKNREAGKLSNDITVLRSNGTIANTTAGLTIEPTIYGSQHINVMHNIRPNINVDRPPIVISILAGYSLHREQTRLVTMTKHIARTGIVDSIVAYEKGAYTSTKNLAWDALTGQILLSSFKNEFGDDIFSLTKPAHWMYKGMSGAYENQNLLVELNCVTGVATDPSNALFKGDELIKADMSSTASYFVLDRVGSQVSIVDAAGQPVVTGTYQFRVKRSGHRNILSEVAEGITLMKNPINKTNGTYSIDKDWVLTAKAFVYDDIRRVLPSDKFCFRLGCPSNTNYGLTPDTTSFGYQTLFSQNMEMPGNTGPIEGPSNYGRPVYDNCCSQGGGGGGESFISPPQNPGICLYSCASAGYTVNQEVNPFLLGIRGVWKINGEYVYFEKGNSASQRVQTLSDVNDANTTTLRYDGRYVDFKEFWQYSAGNWSSNSVQQTSNPWTWNEYLTQTDNLGNPVQTSNAMNINAAQLYGYGNRKKLTAIAANAKNRNILFDGFEDIGTNSNITWSCDSATGQFQFANPISNDWYSDFCEQYRHWPVAKIFLGGNNRISDKVSHTGLKSVQLGRGETQVPLSGLVLGSATANTSLMSKYYLQTNDFIERFYPESSNDYIVSLWVKESYRNQFELKLMDQGSVVIPITAINTGAAVDGWKQLTYKFTLTTMQNLDKIIFINKAGNKNKLQYCYLDDIRIAPLKSAMKCYVYDYNRLRMMAILDDNNFATFYEYDEEGELVRQKVETEKGILTVSENRKNNRR